MQTLAIKSLIQNLDVSAGRYVTIHHTAYAELPVQGLENGRGAYSREDWTRARQAGHYGPADSTEPDTAFLRRAFGAEHRKLVSGLRFADWANRAGVVSVLELGSGEMITSWAIHGRLPHARYLATDFDPFVVRTCERIPLLAGIEKAVLDIDDIDVALVAQFNVIVAWDVFYAFTTERMIRLLVKIKAAGAVLMICSSQIVGPLRGLSYLIKSRLHGYAARCRAGDCRDHGFKSSLRYHQGLARRTGLKCELVEAPPWAGRSGDSYFFIKLHAA